MVKSAERVLMLQAKIHLNRDLIYYILTHTTNTLNYNAPFK